MVQYDHHDADLYSEPTLEEILSEPIIRLIMECDGVDERDMRGQITQAKLAYESLLSHC